MLIDYPATTPPVISYVNESKESTGSKKITAEGFLSSYCQKDSSFIIYGKTFDENEDDEWNYMSKQEINNLITQYEQQFSMTSDEFLQLKKQGKAPDVFETMVWETLLEFR
ncbi:MAG: hypothetical protein PHP00_15505 [Thiotrichaceae bacterium]|nr:hypothetical protein [Thiotrichaceae bacterium]